MPINMHLWKIHFTKLTWVHFHRITHLGHTFTGRLISAPETDSTRTWALLGKTVHTEQGPGATGRGARAPQTLFCQPEGCVSALQKLLKEHIKSKRPPLEFESEERSVQHSTRSPCVHPNPGMVFNTTLWRVLGEINIRTIFADMVSVALRFLLLLFQPIQLIFAHS